MELGKPGDSEYPMRKPMMTPILNTSVETYTKQVKARNTVERCIGVLKAQFRCLLVAQSLHYNPTMAGKIVNACAILHNIANGLGVPVTNEELIQAEALRLNQDQVSYQIPPITESRRVNPELMGQAAQKALVDMLWRERVH